jgi:hypothetical protein
MKSRENNGRHVSFQNGDVGAAKDIQEDVDQNGTVDAHRSVFRRLHVVDGPYTNSDDWD